MVVAEAAVNVTLVFYDGRILGGDAGDERQCTRRCEVCAPVRTERPTRGELGLQSSARPMDIQLVVRFSL